MQCETVIVADLKRQSSGVTDARSILSAQPQSDVKTVSVRTLDHDSHSCSTNGNERAQLGVGRSKSSAGGRDLEGRANRWRRASVSSRGGGSRSRARSRRNGGVNDT